jgi:hypothetical protein
MCRARARALYTYIKSTWPSSESGIGESSNSRVRAEEEADGAIATYAESQGWRAFLIDKPLG